MEGALSVPLLVRLLLFVALPAVGWLTTSAPRPPSTAPQDGIRVNVTTLRDNGEVSKEQAQQKDVTEIDILVKNQRILRHSSFSLPLEESMLYSISQDSDVLLTLPSFSKKVGSISSLQTTSHYLTGNLETTVEGNALPGKLPETPLRAEPPSSYKVMCQWMEKLRKALCRFWGSMFPVFFMFLNVMVVGVLGAAGVITMLKVLFPVCENKGILQVDKMHVMPVAPLISYPEGYEKTAEKLQDKTCI